MPVRMAVYDLGGRRVRNVPPALLAQGPQSLEWDGQRDDGSPATDGVHFVRVRGPGLDVSRTVVRLR